MPLHSWVNMDAKKDIDRNAVIKVVDVKTGKGINDYLDLVEYNKEHLAGISGVNFRRLQKNRKRQPFFVGCSIQGLWWFRIFGYGIHCRRIADYRLLFSERLGYTRGLTIRGWYIKFIKP